jgi:hypothetical protein
MPAGFELRKSFLRRLPPSPSAIVLEDGEWMRMTVDVMGGRGV